MNLDELTWHLPWTSSQSSCEKCSRARVQVSSECSCFFPWTVSFALSVHCGGECIEAELLSRRPTDNGPPSPLDRNPLRRTLEYTLIHREVPKPIEEQRRALNKQIKGRLTVGSIQWSANGQRGLWQFSAPPFTPRPTRRRRGDSAFTWQENANNKVISFHLIWEGCWVKSPTAIYRNSWFPCFENYFHKRPHRTISVRCFFAHSTDLCNYTSCPFVTYY